MILQHLNPGNLVKVKGRFTGVTEVALFVGTHKGGYWYDVLIEGNVFSVVHSAVFPWGEE